MAVLPLHADMLSNSYYTDAMVELVKEKHDPDKYVGEFQAPGCSLDISWPMMVFWNAEPHPVHGNHYFGIYRRPSLGDLHPAQAYICDATRIGEEVFIGIDTGEGLLYSTYSHDYRSVGDFMIDGGNHNDFVQMSVGNGRAINFRVIDGDIVSAEAE